MCFVCLFTRGAHVTMIKLTSPYRPPPYRSLACPFARHGTSLDSFPPPRTGRWYMFKLVQLGPHYTGPQSHPHPQLCWNLFIMKHLRWASERFAPTWKAFLFSVRVNYLPESELRNNILFSSFRETQEGAVRPDNGQKSDDSAHKQSTD